MRLANGWIGPALGAILLLGCARAAPPEAAKVDAPGSVPPGPRPDASPSADGGSDLAFLRGIGRIGGELGLAAGVGQGECGEIEAVWVKRRAAGGACTRPAECACYTASLLAPFDHDATDLATAKALGKLARKFATHPCPTVCVQGTPDRCKADCVDGHCVAVHLPPEVAPPRHRVR
jgi:hypothetical protein